MKPSNEIFSLQPCLPARPSGCVLPEAGEIKFRAVIKSLLCVPRAGTHIAGASGHAHTYGRGRERESVRTGREHKDAQVFVCAGPAPVPRSGEAAVPCLHLPLPLRPSPPLPVSPSPPSSPQPLGHWQAWIGPDPPSFPQHGLKASLNRVAYAWVRTLHLPRKRVPRKGTRGCGVNRDTLGVTQLFLFCRACIVTDAIFLNEAFFFAAKGTLVPNHIAFHLQITAA